VRTYSLSHLPDPVLLRDLTALVARDRAVTAALLAHLTEVDARRLYAPAGHPSMYSYCVNELHLSDEAAFKRIRAARTARQFPSILAALADGRLHVSAVVLLAPYLTPDLPSGQLSPGTVAPRPGEGLGPPARLSPLAPQRFALQVTFGQSTCEKTRPAGRRTCRH